MDARANSSVLDVTEERSSSSGTGSESGTGSTIEPAQSAMAAAEGDSLEDEREDLASDIEVVEEVQKEDEAVINVPLAISFFLGGLGFLLVFVISSASGTHVIIALLWSSATFVSLSVVGYLTDALMEFPGIASTETSVEPEDAELMEDIDDDPAVELELAEPDNELSDAAADVGVAAEDSDVEQGNSESGPASTL